MKTNDICKSRKIKRTSIKTPLLIPSYSSRAHSNIQNLYSSFADAMPRYHLLSAYDISYGKINRETISFVDYLIIDSGGYETKKYSESSEIKESVSEILFWDETIYHKEISTIIKTHNFENLNIVCFDDCDTDNDYKTQIESAINFFKGYNKYIKTFLCHAEKQRNFIEIDKIIDNIDYLTNFDIIGLTEKELGKSLKDKFNNILKLRYALIENGIDLPIHIFGCFEPLNIILFFLFGADIFDGLSWLRYYFKDGLAINPNQYPIVNKSYVEEDLRNVYEIIRSNIKTMNFLENKMKSFTQTYNINLFEYCLTKDLLRGITDITKEFDINSKV